GWGQRLREFAAPGFLQPGSRVGARLLRRTASLGDQRHSSVTAQIPSFRNLHHAERLSLYPQRSRRLGQHRWRKRRYLRPPERRARCRSLPAEEPVGQWSLPEPRGVSFGNVGRNSVVGPGYIDFDLAISRTFTWKETRRLELRAETFNLTNRRNYL